MKILMVGRGVIATLYGWAFSQAGHEVSYCVRKGRSARAGACFELDLLDARSAPKGIAVMGRMEARCVETLDALDSYDLAILGVRHDQMLEGARELARAPRPRLGVLFFNNYWGEPDTLSGLFPAGASTFGFPLSGGAFRPDGTLVGSLMGGAYLMTPQATGAELHGAVSGLFRSAAFQPKPFADARAWLWLHFAVNAGIIAGALGCAGGIEAFLSSRRELSRAATLVREGAGVVYARGVDRRAEAGEATLATLPPLFAGLAIKLAAGNPAMRRQMRGGSDPAELAKYPLAVLAEARRIGRSCPGLEALEGALLRAARGAAAADGPAATGAAEGKA